MKIPLTLSLLMLALVSQAADLSTGRFRGDYFGVVLPVGVCSNERWVMNVEVAPDGTFAGRILNWDGAEVNRVSGSVPFWGKFAGGHTGPQPWDDDFTAIDWRLGWNFTGSLSAKAGTMKGVLDARSQGGCKYTFTLHRRYKVPQ